jgi:transposase InsO family protein
MEAIKLPPKSPNLNAYAERFVRSIKEACLDHLVLFGENALRKAVREFVTHYHEERNHQGLKNELLTHTPLESTGPLRKRARLDGLFNY